MPVGESSVWAVKTRAESESKIKLKVQHSLLYTVLNYPTTNPNYNYRKYTYILIQVYIYSLMCAVSKRLSKR